MSTITISLPDGSERTLPAPATPLDLAASIGSGLKKAAVAATVDGKETDLTTELADGNVVSIITSDTDEGRHVLRHSTSHVLAQAVTQLFPGAKFSIGPAIENGFYYDFELPDGEDLQRRRPRADRGAHARDHAVEPAVHPLGDVDERGEATLRRPELQGRDHREGRSGSGERRDRPDRRRRPRHDRSVRRRRDQRVPQQPRVRRHVRRSARPVDGPPRPFQTATRLGRLLARQREGPDAAAHLRHGVGVEAGARRPPPPVGGGRQA